MAFNQTLTANVATKQLFDVSYDIVRANQFIPNPTAPAEGIIYSTGSASTTIPTGTLNQILSVQATGIGGALKPTWVAETTIPQPEGLIYSNGTIESSITSGSNGQILSVISGVPTWTNSPAPVPSGNGILLEKSGVVSAIPDGTVTQILTTDGFNNPSWQNNPSPLQQNLTIYCTFSQTNTGTGGTPITASTRLTFNKLGTICILCVSSFVTTTNFTDNSYYLISNTAAIPANWLPVFNTSPVSFPFMLIRSDTGLNVYGTMYINPSGDIIIEGNFSNGGLSMSGITATSPTQYISYIAASAGP